MEFIKSINYQGTGRPIAADYDGAGNLIKDTYAKQDAVDKSIDNLQKAIDAGGTAATISITENASSTYAKAYVIKQGTKEIGTINIPKDMVVNSGSLKTVTSADNPYTGAKVGDKYIDLVIANSTNEHIYIPVSDLIDTYLAGNGLTLEDSTFSIKKDTASESYLTVSADGIKISGVDKALNSKVDKEDDKSLVLTTEITKLAQLPNKTDLDNSIAAAKNSGDNAQSSIDAHKKDTGNPHSVTKSQVGLNNVDNTSDMNKPISTATQNALDAKVDKEKDKGLSTNDYTTEEKTKLEGIEENANNYSLPTASASTLGGIKVGDNLSISNGVLSSKDTTYSTATQSANGLMSSTDKTKLDGIAAGANNYTLPTATTSVLGGVKSSTTGTTADRDYKVEVNADGTMKVNVPWVNTTYSNATTSAAGLMSGADKAKLDGIADNANNYTLPTATTTTLGGVIVDASLNSSSTNPVQNKAIKTAIDEINSQLSWTKID